MDSSPAARMVLRYRLCEEEANKRAAAEGFQQTHSSKHQRQVDKFNRVTQQEQVGLPGNNPTQPQNIPNVTRNFNPKERIRTTEAQSRGGLSMNFLERANDLDTAMVENPVIQTRIRT